MTVILRLLFLCLLCIHDVILQNCHPQSSLDYKGRYFQEKRINSTEISQWTTTPTIYSCHHLCQKSTHCIALSYRFSQDQMNCAMFNRTRIQDLLIDDAHSASIILLPMSCGLDDAVDGSWSEWTDVGNCTSGCGHGVKQQQRSCSNPVPHCNGHLCEGNSTREIACNSGTCEPPWFNIMVTSAAANGTEILKQGNIVVNDNSSVMPRHERFSLWKVDPITGIASAAQLVEFHGNGQLAGLGKNVERIPQGQLVLICGFNSFPHQDLGIKQFEFAGVDEAVIKPGGCFCFIGCHLCGPGFPYIQQSKDAFDGLCRCSFHGIINTTSHWNRIFVTSISKRLGFMDRDSTYFINQQQRDINQRGMNVIQYLPMSGQVTEDRFDLQFSPYSYRNMSNLIEKIEQGTIVMLSVYDSAMANPFSDSEPVTSDAYRQLGASDVVLNHRDCFCLIGCKDCGPTFPYIEKVSNATEHLCDCMFEGFLML